MLKPGKELDALVAEKVMGIDLTAPCNGEMEIYYTTPYCVKCGYEFSKDDYRYGPHTYNPRHYSTSIAAAWEVVEKLNLSVVQWEKKWLVVEFGYGISDYSNYPLQTEPWLLIEESFYGVEDYTIAETAPLAICLAALKTVEYEP